MAVISICVYSLNTPFLKPEDDLLAMFAQWGVFLTLFSGLLLKLNLNKQDQVDHDGVYFGYFLVFVNGLVLIVAISAFLYEVWRGRKNDRRQKEKIQQPDDEDSTVSNPITHGGVPEAPDGKSKKRKLLRFADFKPSHHARTPREPAQPSPGNGTGAEIVAKESGVTAAKEKTTI